MLIAIHIPNEAFVFSVTLFLKERKKKQEMMYPMDDVFVRVSSHRFILEKYFKGNRCIKTINLVKREIILYKPLH